MSATRIIALAALACRAAIRSRLLLSLTALLLLGLLALPSLIEGDGTLVGRLQIVVRYALGFTSFILSVATLWAGCGAVALEMEDRRIYLIASKPVPRHELWLGKWLAIMGLDAGLLALAGIIVAGMLVWTVRNDAGPASVRQQASDQVLVARTSLPAPPPGSDFDAQVAREVNRVLATDPTRSAMAPSAIEPAVRKQMLRTAFSVTAERALTLRYRLPRERLGSHDLTLTFKALSAQPGYIPVALRWTFGEGERAVHLTTTNYPGRPWQQTIPCSTIAPDGTLTITLAHDTATPTPPTLILAPDGEPPELLVPAGGFGANLIRALLMLLCRLAFLAALGVSAGCLLSMPVAVFVACFVMVLLALSGYVAHVSALGAYYVPHEGAALEQTWIDHVTIGLFRGCNTLTLPLRELDPIPLLADGRRLAWRQVAAALGLIGGLYAGAVALIGMALFRRRELG